MDASELKTGIPIFKLLHQVGLAQSGSAARRLINQGGAYINGNRVDSDDYLVTINDIADGEILLRAGKKKFFKVFCR